MPPKASAKAAPAPAADTVEARLLTAVRDVRQKERAHSPATDLREQIYRDLTSLSPARRTAFLDSVSDKTTRILFTRIVNTEQHRERTVAAAAALTKDEEAVAAALLELAQSAPKARASAGAARRPRTKRT